VSNCAAINLAPRRGRSAADRGVAPVTIARTRLAEWHQRHADTASRAANSSSGGAHTRHLRAECPQPYGRQYLLTGGLAMCWRCGHGLIARAQQTWKAKNGAGDHQRSYVCADPQYGIWPTHADGSPLPPDPQGRTNCGTGRLRIIAEPF